MNVNQLDDDSLILIFKQFTTQELIHLRGVCSRWQLIIEQLCAGKRSIKLFAGFANVYQYCNDLINFCQEESEHLKLHDAPLDDDLVMPLDRPEVCQFLAGLFPRVEQLVAYLNQTSANQLPSLLQNLPDLEKLSLFGEIPSNFVFQQQLCIAISSLTSLTHLELFKEPNYSNDESVALTLPIPAVMSKLECFSLIGFECDIVQILGQFGQNLKRLTLDRLPLHQLQRLFQTNPKFGENLNYLNVDDLDEGSLQFICDKFHALKSLEIGLDDVKITDIARSLLNLKNLTDLRFKTFGIDQLEPQNLESLPQLNSIKKVYIYKLNIFAQSLSGPNQLCQTLSALFPAAEAIYLRNENPRHTPAVLAGIIKDNLSPDELGYLARYQIYSTAELKHIGRHRERCKKEKTSRKLRMWDYEEPDQFDHNARLGRLSIGAAILQRRQNPNMWDNQSDRSQES